MTAATPVVSLPALQDVPIATTALVSSLLTKNNSVNETRETSIAPAANQTIEPPVPDRSAEVEAALREPNQSTLEALNAQLLADLDIASAWQSEIEDRSAAVIEKKEALDKVLQPYHQAEAVYETASVRLELAEKTYEEAQKQWRFTDPRVKEARRNFREAENAFDDAKRDLRRLERSFRDELKEEAQVQAAIRDIEAEYAVTGDIFSRLEFQRRAVSAALDVFLVDYYRDVAEEQRPIIDDLSGRLRTIEQMPIDEGSAEAQLLALADLYDDLQHTAATLLAAATASGRQTETSRQAFAQLNSDLWTIRQRWHACNNKILLFLEKLHPSVIKTDVDLKPEEIRSVRRGVQADLDLPESVGGQFRLQSWNGGAIKTATLTTKDVQNGTELLLTGNAFTFDFRDAGRRIIGAEFEFEALNGSTEMIGMHVFSGQRETSAGNFRPGAGFITAGDPEGMTSLVIIPRDAVRAAGVRLKRLRLITGDPVKPEDKPEALAPLNNALVAQLAAPTEWAAGMETFTARDWDHFLASNNITAARSGVTVANGKYMLPWDTLSADYERFSARSSQGGATFSKLYYVTGQSLHELPDDYYRVSGADVIVAPNVPGKLVMDVRSNGGTVVQWETSDTKDTTLESVSPPTQMKVSIDYLKLEAQPTHNEGFGPGYHEIVDQRRPVVNFGQEFEALVNVRNHSPVGGTVIIDVHAGPSGTRADHRDSTWSTYLGPYETKSLSVNAAAQGDSSQGRPTISFHARLPDGSESSSTIASGTARSADPQRVYENGQIAYREQQLTDEQRMQLLRINSRVQVAYGKRVESGREYAFDDHIDYDRAWNIALEEYGSERQRIEEELADILVEPEIPTEATAAFRSEDLQRLREGAKAAGLRLDELLSSIDKATQGEFFVYSDGVKTMRLPAHLATRRFAHTSIEAGDVFIGFEKRSDGSIEVTLVSSNIPKPHSELVVSPVYTTFVIARRHYEEAVRNGVTDDFFTRVDAPGRALWFGNQALKATKEFIEKEPSAYVPEEALDVLRAKPVSDYEGHLGADYIIPEGTPIVWTGPRAKVIEMTTISKQTENFPNGDSYGTMAVKLEIDLPQSGNFEAESGQIIQTNKIHVFFGHLRPSQQSINDSSPNSRFAKGLASEELSYAVGTYIDPGTVLGYVETKDYGGFSSEPHVHVGAYDAYKKPSNPWQGNDAGPNDVSWNIFIKPEKLWAALQ